MSAGDEYLEINTGNQLDIIINIKNQTFWDFKKKKKKKSINLKFKMQHICMIFS